MNGIPRVVFDTNILFSALGWMGSPHRCVQAAREGRCLSCTCEEILSELADKLRLKRGFDDSRVTEVLEEIRAFSTSVSIVGGLKVVTADPDDDAVLECALVAGARYLVSGDRHLLQLEKHEQVRILRAEDFLAMLPQVTKD